MLRLKLIRRLCASAFAIALGACSLPFFSDWEESVAVVDGRMVAEGEAIQLDSAVAVGSRGRVSIITGGSGSCTRFGRTAVNWRGPSIVEITPYNENLRTNNPCTADFHFFYHEARVRYTQPGTYTVRIRAVVQLRDHVEQIAERTVRVY